jgi:hypothetical protein
MTNEKHDNNNASGNGIGQMQGQQCQQNYGKDTSAMTPSPASSFPDTRNIIIIVDPHNAIIVVAVRGFVICCTQPCHGHRPL